MKEQNNYKVCCAERVQYVYLITYHYCIAVPLQSFALQYQLTFNLYNCICLVRMVCTGMFVIRILNK